ncbi:carboxylating nicotinate-nucleotide diphosphorylase [Rubrobacter indicoceani]|uniref:carboxylating nicotinate-nucleotide diphosphorylase n=1 Tax=Rubrobacter indicoceani TaxID=2051957 RepID=UPI000E5BBA99|nr:carboxylating nicotinate-nucleotide diphosphorylase [Rubrobacter indicoceani]
MGEAGTDHRERTAEGRFTPGLHDFIRAALAEDLGRGDKTSELTIPAEARAGGRFIAKSDLTVYGLAVARAVLEAHVPEGGITFTQRVSDGEAVEAGTVLAEIEGPARSILGAERVALNLIMRLSGIATLTARFVAEVAGTGAKVTDTRKTTPGLRSLEKAAVLAGGGTNHRSGLDDGVLIKDNHIAVAGGLGRAVRLAKTGAPHLLKVEVEVEDEAGLYEAVSAGADAVLFDNMTPEEVAGCVCIIRRERPEVIVEVSGNVGLHNIRLYAEAGPDLISVGALTHSATAADISLKLAPETGGSL